METPKQCRNLFKVNNRHQKDLFNFEHMSCIARVLLLTLNKQMLAGTEQSTVWKILSGKCEYLYKIREHLQNMRDRENFYRIAGG